MPEITMRELVERLRADNSEALIELLEFDYALEEFLRGLSLLAVASRGLHSAAQTLAPADDQEASERVAAVQEQAGRLSARMTQALGAFREVYAGVLGWQIADPRRRSSRPVQSASTAPPIEQE